MKIPSIEIVFDRKGVADNSTKKGLLQVRVYHQGITKYYSTGVKLLKGQWHPTKGVVNHPDSFNVNQQVRAFVSQITAMITKQVESDGDFSFSNLKQSVESNKSSRSLYDILDEVIAKENAVGMSYSTVMQYNTLRNRLEEYGKIREIDNLTLDSISKFDLWMKTEQHYSDNTVYGYHSKLRCVCNMLVTKDLLSKNPYGQFKLKRAKEGDVKYLTSQELDKVKALYLDKPQYEYARDFFLFQAMTGLSCIDVLSLKQGDIELRKGKRVLVNRRVKNAQQFAIVIMQPAWEILQRHGGTLDEYTMSRINILLHDIGEWSIGKRLTTHMARHTFATWALSNGIPIEYVSKMLGHTNITTTQRYAKVLAQDVLDQFGTLEKALSKSEDTKPIRRKVEVDDKRKTNKKSGPKRTNNK